MPSNPENLICPLERSFQSSRALQLNNTNIFIPECNETDGSYLPVQVLYYFYYIIMDLFKANKYNIMKFPGINFFIHSGLQSIKKVKIKFSLPTKRIKYLYY